MARLLTALIALASLAYLPLQAADNPPATSMNFRVFGVGNDAYEGLYYFNGRLYLPLTFHKVSRSVETYQYAGILDFGVFVKNSDYVASDPTSLPYIQIATTTLSPQTDTGLLVFNAHPDNKNADDVNRRFQIFLIDDSENYFARNSIIIVNATGANLFGRVGDEDLMLPSGASEPVSYPNSKSGKTTKMTFALQTEEGICLVMSNDIHISNNRRIVLILLPPKKPNSMRITTRKLSQSIYPKEQDL